MNGANEKLKTIETNLEPIPSLDHLSIGIMNKGADAFAQVDHNNLLENADQKGITNEH